jgi:hypothetical protein
VELSANSFSINPYDGLFDVGADDMQGWNSTTTGPYVVKLSGDAALSTADFTAFDSLGNLYAAVHIQDIGSATGEDCDGSGDKPACVPGMPGPGSLKIGAFTTIPGGKIPEPSTLGLFGVAALLLGLLKRRG